MFLKDMIWSISFCEKAVIGIQAVLSLEYSDIFFSFFARQEDSFYFGSQKTLFQPSEFILKAKIFSEKIQCFPEYQERW